MLAGGGHVVGVLHRARREARVGGDDTIRVPLGPRGRIRRAEGEPVHSPARRETAEEVVEGVVLHHEHHDVLNLRHRVGTGRHVRKGQRARVAQGRLAQGRQRRRDGRLAGGDVHGRVPRRRLLPPYGRACGERAGTTQEGTAADRTVHARENSRARPPSRRFTYQSRRAMAGRRQGVRSVTNREHQLIGDNWSPDRSMRDTDVMTPDTGSSRFRMRRPDGVLRTASACRGRPGRKRPS